MGNCASDQTIRAVSKKKKELPIETIFKLPSDIPVWPQGQGFATGTIVLGELQVHQISTFNRVWSSNEGGPDNAGAAFFEPTAIPDGFHMLGCYAQPNNKPLFGSVLVARDVSAADNSGSALAKPLDYALVWSSEAEKIKRNGNGFFWLPTPPEGYKAVGFVVTDSPEKPPVGKVRCVRADLTEPCEGEASIWGINAEGFNVYALRPTNRGMGAIGVPAGTFTAQTGPANPIPPLIACLKNAKSKEDFSSLMPNLDQLEAVFKAYSPLIYFHPEEKYLPSSVSWYFEKGAVLYKRGEESGQPVEVLPDGSNLPLGGANDEEYWLDLPVEKAAKERLKRGDLANARVYLHAKAMLGATYTDVAVWIFYPFNGPGKAKVGPINVPLGRIGEHIGDWEHVTLHVSNFSGALERLYLSEHSKGTWFDAPEVEFVAGTNKPVVYSSLNGHANYAKPGLFLQGSGGVGIRNDTAKSKMVMDTAKGFEVVAAEYLPVVVEPPWLNYLRKWGPKIDYDTREEFERVEKAILIGALKKAFRKFVNGLPSEVFGEDGPTGPKVKGSWSGDEPY